MRPSDIASLVTSSDRCFGVRDAIYLLSHTVGKSTRRSSSLLWILMTKYREGLLRFNVITFSLTSYCIASGIAYIAKFANASKRRTWSGSLVPRTKSHISHISHFQQPSYAILRIYMIYLRYYDTSTVQLSQMAAFYCFL